MTVDSDTLLRIERGEITPLDCLYWKADAEMLREECEQLRVDLRRANDTSRRLRVVVAAARVYFSKTCLTEKSGVGPELSALANALNWADGLLGKPGQ